MAKYRENGAEIAVLAKFWAFLPNGQPKFFLDNPIWVAGCPVDNQHIFLIPRPASNEQITEEQNIGRKKRLYAVIRRD